MCQLYYLYVPAVLPVVLPEVLPIVQRYIRPPPIVPHRLPRTGADLATSQPRNHNTQIAQIAKPVVPPPSQAVGRRQPRNLARSIGARRGIKAISPLGDVFGQSMVKAATRRVTEQARQITALQLQIKHLKKDAQESTNENSLLRSKIKIIEVENVGLKKECEAVVLERDDANRKVERLRCYVERKRKELGPEIWGSASVKQSRTE